MQLPTLQAVHPALRAHDLVTLPTIGRRSLCAAAAGSFTSLAPWSAFRQGALPTPSPTCTGTTASSVAHLRARRSPKKCARSESL